MTEHNDPCADLLSDLRGLADEQWPKDVETYPCWEGYARTAVKLCGDELRAVIDKHATPEAQSERADGATLIAVERRRQIDCKGWTPQHDAQHDSDDLALAAVAYALPENRRYTAVPRPGNTSDRGDAYDWKPRYWPWESEVWKPSSGDRVRELVKAGALIAAEIDRQIAQGEARSTGGRS